MLLLAQADGLFIPKTSGLFLAPSLALTSITLFSVGLCQAVEPVAHLHSKTTKDAAGEGGFWLILGTLSSTHAESSSCSVGTVVSTDGHSRPCGLHP